MGRIRKLTSTQNFSPVRDVRDGIVITRDGGFVKLMEFSPINFELRSREEQRAILARFGALLRTMPQEIQFKVLSKRADTARLTETVRSDMETEEEPGIRALQEEQISLIREAGEAGGVSRRFFAAFRCEGRGPGRKTSFEAARAELERQAEAVRAALRQCGNEPLSADGDDTWTLSALYAVLSRSAAERTPFDDRMYLVIANYAKQNNLDFSKPIMIPVNDFLSPGVLDPSRSPRYLCADGVYYCFLYIRGSSYPQAVAGGWPALFYPLGEGVDVDIWLRKEPPAAARQKLQYGLRFSRLRLREAENTSADYDELESRVKSGYALKSGLAGGDDLCYFGTMLTVTADSLPALEARTAEVRSFCVRAGLRAVPCTFRQLDAFTMALPLCRADRDLWKRMRRNILLSRFASAYPFTSFEMADAGGIVLGTNRQTGSLVVINPFDTDRYSNANICVLGATGSGKTYLLQCLALRMREKKTRVFVIAPWKGEEFRRAARAAGGQHIVIAPGSEQNINVMEIRPGRRGGSQSVLIAKIQQLRAFFSLVYPGMTPLEEQLLDDALLRTYARFGITEDDRSLPDPRRPGRYRPMPVLGDLEETLAGLPDGRAGGLRVILSRFTRGSWSSFNAQTNVDLDSPFIVLDVSRLDDDALTLGMFVAIDFVWDRAREDRTETKLIAIDEISRLIGARSSPPVAKSVVEIFRTIRGYGGAVLGASQDTADFFSSSGGYGSALMNQSRIKFLLRVDTREVDTLRGVLGLTEAECDRLRTVERGTALLIANTDHVFVDIRATETEHDLITTDRKDYIRLRDREGDGFDL